MRHPLLPALLLGLCTPALAQTGDRSGGAPAPAAIDPAEAEDGEDGEDGKEDDATAEEEFLEGHSHLGEAFNEGPRQAAYLMGDPDRLHFPVQTESEAPQAFFTQGLGQLHGFWFFESERSFRQAAALAPEFAMAYWGMAMANVDNEERATDFSREAWLRRESASEHGRMHIDALAEYYDVDYAVEDEEKELKKRAKAEERAEKADEKDPGAARERKQSREKSRSQAYITALEEILWEYPDDLETKALLVNFLWLARYKGVPTASKASIEALIQQVLAVEPLHPVHHYRIHLWDSKDTVEYVVDSAVNAGHSWPSVAHQWHMGGHIFDKLGRHADAAWQQEASARTDHAHLMRDRVLPDQIHNFAHNNEWLTRSMRQVGRMHDAIDLAMNMIELPRHPEWNRLDKRGCSASFGRRRLFEVLELYEQWETLVALSDTMYLEPSEDAGDEAYRFFMLGEAHAFLGDHEQARAQVAVLERLVADERVARAAAVDLAEEEALAADEKPSEVTEAMQAALDAHAADLRSLRGKIESLNGLLLVLETEPLALPEVPEVVEAEETEETDVVAEVEEIEEPEAIEEEIAEADEYEDGEEVSDAAEDEDPKKQKRPAPEYPDDVQEALKALRTGSLPKEHVARIHFDLGLLDEAESLARDAAKDAEGRAVPQANLAFVLEALGEREEALEVFETLRGFSARFDIEAPPFARLAPLAEAAGQATDWRVPFELPEDVGERPDLDSLGPMRWAPPPALAWTCEDANGVERSLSDYAGRPVVVILFLGFGCLHCVEQLEAFAPAAQGFADAGIEIVAIGNDDREAMASSLETYDPGEAPPFPILADPDMQVFHSHRSYDDFEDQPLHGTFLVDAKGRVRWQDISFEPFLDHEFLLAEAQRLLGLPDDATAISAAAPTAGSANSAGGGR